MICILLQVILLQGLDKFIIFDIISMLFINQVQNQIQITTFFYDYIKTNQKFISANIPMKQQYHLVMQELRIAAQQLLYDEQILTLIVLFSQLYFSYYFIQAILKISMRTKYYDMIFIFQKYKGFLLMCCHNKF
ncbi:unnamed protein product [Paramecium pentaurelia]|uniref:Transmembrane protein n=1 Tax=Paramecium pentaurelia TaxID=43138 RepID=A0A8S1V6J6_9CILI|nr:unnamed protein product [Paramecium pentaurelia]